MGVFPYEECITQPCFSQNLVGWQWVFLWEMDSASSEEHATEIWSDYHSTGRVYNLKKIALLAERRRWLSHKAIDVPRDKRSFSYLWQPSKKSRFVCKISWSDQSLFLTESSRILKQQRIEMHRDKAVSCIERCTSGRTWSLRRRRLK